MAKRFLWMAALAGLLFAGSGIARFLHLHAAHVGHFVANEEGGGHTHCHHGEKPPAQAPERTPHSSDDCQTCFLLSAALKCVTPVLILLPACDNSVVALISLHDSAHVAVAILHSASPRGPPTVSH